MSDLRVWLIATAVLSSSCRESDQGGDSHEVLSVRSCLVAVCARAELSESIRSEGQSGDALSVVAGSRDNLNGLVIEGRRVEAVIRCPEQGGCLSVRRFSVMETKAVMDVKHESTGVFSENILDGSGRECVVEVS